MTIIQSIILGIVQGLTEYIPVSSSAHLVIIPYLLNWEIPPTQAFLFDVLVQVATLIAVIIYFWHDLIEISKGFIDGIVKKNPFGTTSSRLGWLILLASIPAGLIGLILKDVVEQAFNSPTTAAYFLFITAALLVIAERVGNRSRELKELNWKDALWVGFFQSTAIFPGISRSGATITGGMTRNFQRVAAARFSFLISIPIMLAAGALATYDLLKIEEFSATFVVFIPGFITAAITGYLAIRWLLKFLVGHTLYDFAIYCVILGLITLMVSFIR